MAEALQTGLDGLPILAQPYQAAMATEDTYRIAQMRIIHQCKTHKFPQLAIPARMFVAIYWQNSQKENVELLRDSTSCVLRTVSDGTIEVCFEKIFSIPHEKLRVKKVSGATILDISYGMPDRTTNQIWFETMSYQEAWPLLGSAPTDDFRNFFNKFENSDLARNETILTCSNSKLFNTKYHTASLKMRLYKDYFPTSLWLSVRMEEAQINILPEQRAAASYQSPPPTAEPREQVSRKDSVAISRKRKRSTDDDDDYGTDREEGQSEKRSSARVSRREISRNTRKREEEDSIMDVDDSEPEDDRRRGRTSRNKKPIYDSKGYFKEVFRNGLEDDAPPRTSQCIRTRSKTISTDHIDTTVEAENEVAIRPQRSVAKVIRVPKSRRPLYSITTRRMLIAGDELHDSDDEPEDEHAIQRNINSINDITDITTEEKEFCVKWNLWSFKKGNGSSCGTYLQRNLIRFCQENQEWFLEKNHRIREMCKFWKVARDRVNEVTINTWVECLKFLEPDSGLWQ